MGFRFRKSIKLMPGIRLNISKSGVTTSVGTRGATVNIGAKRIRTTVGIPGSGLSYTTSKAVPPSQQASIGRVVWVIALLGLAGYVVGHFLLGM